MNRPLSRQTLLLLGFTAIFVGYLVVWLPGPGAGLSLLGIEMGEWFKFLGLGPRRDLFYLPPITLGLMLALWTVTWAQGGWQAWAVRALAIFVSLLAFPAIEDITGPARDQYTLRVIMIVVVVLVALLSGFWQARRRWQNAAWLLLVLLGLLGAVLPTWLYFQARPFLAEIVGTTVGVGPGVWLNLAGHVLVTAVALLTVAVPRPSAEFTANGALRKRKT